MAGATRRSGRSGCAIRRRIHQSPGDGRFRGGAGTSAGCMGLGRRTVFDLLRRGPGPGPGHRLAEFCRVSQWCASTGRAFPLRATGSQFTGPAGAGGHLESQFPGRRQPRGVALRSTSAPPARVPAATGDGEQRQVRAPRRRARGMRHRSGDLGRAGLKRPAFVLPAPAPGHGAGLGGLSPACNVRGGSPGSAESRRGQLSCPGVGSCRRRSARQHRRPAQGPCRQPSDQPYPVPTVGPGDAGQAHRPVRAQGLHPGGDLGRQQLRSVGGGTGQAPGFEVAGPRDNGRRAADNRTSARQIEKWRG